MEKKEFISKKNKSIAENNQYRFFMDTCILIMITTLYVIVFLIDSKAKTPMKIVTTAEAITLFEPITTVFDKTIVAAEEYNLDNGIEEAFKPYGCKVNVSESATTRISITQEEIELMARVIMSEASTQNYDCKVAIAEVIINRVRSDKYPDSVTGVIMQPRQFSTQNNGAVNGECYEAVNEALYTQRHPSDMMYFRTGYYHTWARSYCKIDDTYFSRT